jgi:hypothetical protein
LYSDKETYFAVGLWGGFFVVIRCYVNREGNECGFVGKVGPIGHVIFVESADDAIASLGDMDVGLLLEGV